MVDIAPEQPTAPRPATRLAAAGSLAALLLAAAAAGAAAAERNSFAYDPPDRPPRGTRVRYVELPAETALNQIASRLREQGLTVERMDESARLVVARFSGDPRDFVDCGVVRMLVDGKAAEPPKQYSANRPETRTYRTVRGGRRVGILRELHLDARVAVRRRGVGQGRRGQQRRDLRAHEELVAAVQGRRARACRQPRGRELQVERDRALQEGHELRRDR
jgi:hypothetical protein